MLDFKRIIGITIILLGITACSSNPGARVDITQDLDTAVEETEKDPTLTLEVKTQAQTETAKPMENKPSQIPTETTPEPVVTFLTIWHGLDEEGLLAFREILSAFQRQDNGIKITLVYRPVDDLLEQYISSVEADEGPDILLGAGEWGQTLYDQDVAVDVSDYYSDEVKSEINQAALTLVTYPDLIAGLPYGIHGVVMYRNKSVIPEPPANFNDLIVKAREVTTPDVLGAYLDRGSIYSFSQLTACGGFLMYENGYPAFNNRAGECWLNLLESYSEAGAVAYNSLDDLQRFRAGAVGTIIDGTWNLGILLDSLGDDLVVDPWPEFNNSNLSGYVWSENIFISPHISDEGAVAAKIFSLFMLSNQAQVILSRHGFFPAITNLEVDDPIVLQVVTALSKGTPFPRQPELEYYFEPLFNSFEAFFKQGTPASESLQSAADQIISDIDEFENITGGT